MNKNNQVTPKTKRKNNKPKSEDLQKLVDNLNRLLKGNNNK